MTRYKWLVKIKLLNHDEKLSIAEISIMSASEARKELDGLQPHVYRRLIRFGRTRYKEKSYTVKLKWFYSTINYTPPTGEIYEWLLAANSLIRTVNRRDA